MMLQVFVKNFVVKMNFNSINLDISYKCPNKCPACYRQRNVEYFGKDMTKSDIEKIAKYFNIIRFCGQISDPIMHSDFHEILEVCLNYNIKVQIHTAVSARPVSWWEKSFKMCIDKDVEWVFGIDGLPKDSHKYRINQDGEKLFEIMKLCSNMNIKTTWQYIVFKYNEINIDECKQLAQENNILFRLGKSARYNRISAYNMKIYKSSKEWESPSKCDTWVNESGEENTSCSTYY